MKEIELFEKLVEVQEMHIELMNDYNNLQCSYKDLEEIKNRRIKDLNIQIQNQDEKIVALNREINELKKQYEELQNSLITVEDNNQ